MLIRLLEINNNSWANLLVFFLPRTEQRYMCAMLFVTVSQINRLLLVTPPH